MRRFFSSNDLTNKCIDTRPDKNLPSNLDKWGDTVSKIKSFYKHFPWVPMLLYAGGLAILISPEVSISVIPGMLRVMRGFHRWHKVEAGEWRITDKGPPPEPVRQAKRNLVPAAVGAFARQIAPAL